MDQKDDKEDESTVPAPPPDPSTYLAVQDLSKLNITELSPLTHEVISRQATINIGTSFIVRFL